MEEILLAIWFFLLITLGPAYIFACNRIPDLLKREQPELLSNIKHFHFAKNNVPKNSLAFFKFVMFFDLKKLKGEQIKRKMAMSRRLGWLILVLIVAPLLLAFLRLLII